MHYQATIAKKNTRIFYLIAMLIFSTVLTAFLNPGNKGNRTSHDFNQAAVDYLPSYKLKYDDISPFLSWPPLDKRIILQFSLNYQSPTSTPPASMNLVWYISKGMETNGWNQEEHKLEPVEAHTLNFQPGLNYVFGNNYVSVARLRDAIRESGIDPEYLWLVPKVDATRHVYFEIKVEAERNLYDLKTTTVAEGPTSSNPSPPADPQ